MNVISKIAPWILAAAVALGGTSAFLLKGWADERQARKDAESRLTLADSVIESSAATAERLRKSSERGAAELASYKVRLSQIQATNCFNVVPMPDDAVRLYHEAYSRAAERALSRAD